MTKNQYSRLGRQRGHVNQTLQGVRVLLQIETPTFAFQIKWCSAIDCTLQSFKCLSTLYKKLDY